MKKINEQTYHPSHQTRTVRLPLVVVVVVVVVDVDMTADFYLAACTIKMIQRYRRASRCTLSKKTNNKRF